MKIKFVPFLLFVVILATLLLLVTPTLVYAQGPGPVTGVPDFQLTPEGLTWLSAFVLSVLFKYFPKLNTWYAGLEADSKSWIMICLLLLITISVTVLACFGLLNMPGFVCGKVGFIQVAYTFIFAVVANQGAYLAFPEPKSVKAVRAAKKLTTASNPADTWQNSVQ